jgi:3-(methylthio)propanoyl-CoA dehydrogenase
LALESVIDYVVGNAKSDIKDVYAGAATYLRLAGVVVCGWQMARALMVALDKKSQDPAFYGAKIITCRFYAETIMAEAQGLASTALNCGSTINAMSNDMF